MPLKKTFMKKVILNREKVLQNDYLLIDDIASLPKSDTKKVIVTAPQWLKNKKTLKDAFVMKEILDRKF